MPEVQTRAQHMLATAFGCVSAVKSEASPKVQEHYTTIAQNVSVTVRASGLAQALAFAHAKAANRESDRERAYGLVLDHLAAALAMPAEQLLSRVQGANALEYMRYTRTVLDSWVYFRRFVSSLLEVDAAPTTAFSSATG